MAKTRNKTTGAAVKKPAARTPSASRERANTVPETAENFEHILRRLVIAKEKARAESR